LANVIPNHERKEEAPAQPDLKQETEKAKSAKAKPKEEKADPKKSGDVLTNQADIFPGDLPSKG
jgi:hypothetical protein